MLQCISNSTTALKHRAKQLAVCLFIQNVLICRTYIDRQKDIFCFLVRWTAVPVPNVSAVSLKYTYKVSFTAHSSIVEPVSLKLFQVINTTDLIPPLTIMWITMVKWHCLFLLIDYTCKKSSKSILLIRFFKHFSRSTHLNKVTLDTALPLILSNTPDICEIDQTKVCWDTQRTYIQTFLPLSLDNQVPVLARLLLFE